MSSVVLIPSLLGELKNLLAKLSKETNSLTLDERIELEEIVCEFAPRLAKLAASKERLKTNGN